MEVGGRGEMQGWSDVNYSGLGHLLCNSKIRQRCMYAGQSEGNIGWRVSVLSYSVCLRDGCILNDVEMS